MKVKTHEKVNIHLVGRPISIKDDEEAVVELKADWDMAVDERRLIHGGFTFGLADYAAMLAVNHPNVVLGASRVRFLAPVRSNDVMVARALVVKREGKRRDVEVNVSVGDKEVLTGNMTCYILSKHVLEQ